MKNPSAFPVTGYSPDFNGMTLRDYFAAKALQGLLANPKLQKEILAQGGCLSGWIEDSAYGFADAMLKARET
jgi:hypothetical protein